MAKDLVSTQNVFAPILGMSRLPLLRQFGVLIGLAASVALGVAVVLWAQTPSYRLLYGNLTEKDQARVLDELQKANIPHKLDTASGAVMVPEKNVHGMRLKLAAQGLPKGANRGFELLEGNDKFGNSQFIETARYQHALEGELARSIMNIGHVQGARVHLAIPKQSVFVRNRQQASASVVINLYPGRRLDDGQVAAIVHLIASSIPNLEADRVTVVDQMGRLLTTREGLRDFELTANQFDYARRLEDAYVKRIEHILTPIIGPGGVRAQVAADMDFTLTEQTQESYKPDPTALRSEQVAEERTLPGAEVAGIPGALSNQPPGAGSVAPSAPTAAAAKATENESKSAVDRANTSRRATRNYELDKTISHTRRAPGRIKRLSVAVVVDNRQALNDDGEVERKPLSEKELERVIALVKEAVGFSTERGDSVQVLNTPFTTPPEPEPLPDPPLLEQPWLWDLGKQALGGIVVLLLIFGVLRPMLRGLATRSVVADGGEGAVAALGHSSAASRLTGGQSYETHLSNAKQIVGQDPKRVAQVVKNWVADDA